MQVDFSWIFQLVFIALFFFMYLYGTRLQTYMFTRQVEAALKQLDTLATQAKQIASRSLRDLKVAEEDVIPIMDRFLEYFLIEPTDRDPSGFYNRLKMVLDVRESHYEKELARIAPKATPEESANTGLVLSGAGALYYVFRVVRHFLILGKKTKSIYYVMQLQMQMPMIMKMAKAYFEATRAFADGKPIGDGMGALAVASFARENPTKPPEEIVKNTIAFSGEFEGRTLLFVRAKGHGGTVGHPGVAIEKLVEQNKGKIARIITVDAGMKLEGEETGQVIEGTGAAIGGPGVEKHRIEQAALKYNIPLDAIVIKESLEDALAPMKKVLVEAVPTTVEYIKNTIRLRSDKGDTIILAGIGNTIGIA